MSFGPEQSIQKQEGISFSGLPLKVVAEKRVASKSRNKASINLQTPDRTLATTSITATSKMSESVMKRSRMKSSGLVQSTASLRKVDLSVRSSSLKKLKRQKSQTSGLTSGRPNSSYGGSPLRKTHKSPSSKKSSPSPPAKKK